MDNNNFNKLVQLIKDGKRPALTGYMLTCNQYKELQQYVDEDYLLILKSRVLKAPESSSKRL